MSDHNLNNVRKMAREKPAQLYNGDIIATLDAMLTEAERQRDVLGGIWGRISCAVHALDGKGDNTGVDDVIARIQAIAADRELP